MKQVFNHLFQEYCRIAVAEKAIRQTRLVMTLLARDEADIIEANILFHLNRGVDFIVATDNNSADGTTEILEEYQKQGVLRLIHESSRVFDQAAWVNRMGRIAHESLGADFLFHSDADEFWYPGSGSLKRELLARPWVDVLSVKVTNVVMRSKGGEEVFPRDAIYAVHNPLPERQKLERLQGLQNGAPSLLLYKHHNKVIYRLGKGYLPVIWGNHRIQKSPELPPFRKGGAHDIEILHFPIRGFEQFVKRTINHGEGQENLHRVSPVHPREQGRTNKRWFEIYKEGKLFEEYVHLSLSDADAEEWLRKGVIRKSPEHCLVLQGFLEGHMREVRESGGANIQQRAGKSGATPSPQ